MKKISYCEKAGIVIVAEYLVLFFISVICVLCMAGKISFGSKEKTICLLLLSGILIFLLYAVIRVVIQLPVHYRTICKKFIRGEIYQEFIDNIGTLAPELSGAIGRLDGLLDRQRIIQLSTKQAEFLALQNQINPHFLYNTLDAIRGDALCIGAENIADITEALSTFFRYTITNTKSLVTLQQELDNVDNYFKIQKYRFGEKLSLSVNLLDNEEKLMQMRCPKLCLQPIVENAIFHGIEKKSENGQISIDIEIVDDALHIDISDNGMGMEEQRLLQLNEQLRRASVGYIIEDDKSKKGGIALKNVCRRIKLLFGEGYGLSVSSIVGLGTKVEMVLPVVLKNEEK